MEYKIESNSTLLKSLSSFMYKKYDSKQLIDKFPEEFNKPLQKAGINVLKNIKLLRDDSIILSKEQIHLIEDSCIHFTEAIINLAVQLWYRKIFIQDFLNTLESTHKTLAKVKPLFNIAPHPRQFFNTRLFDLIASMGILYLLNNQLDEAERCFVDKIQEEIHLFHSKQELYLLKKLFILLLAEINIRRGYYSFSEKVALEIDCNKIESTELKFAYFNVALQLGEYYKTQNLIKAIFWYQQSSYIFLKIKKDTAAKAFISFLPEMTNFFDQENVLTHAIKEITNTNSQKISNEIVNLNNPLVEYDKDSSIITLHMVFSFAIKTLKKIKTTNNQKVTFEIQKDKITLSNIGELDSDILLKSINEIIKSHNSFLENRARELLQSQNIITSTLKNENLPTFLQENKQEQENTSQKPKVKTRKPSSNTKKPSKETEQAKTPNAEELGFNPEFNNYHIISFYNDYIPEGIHYGFFDASKTKKVDSKILELHKVLLYEKHKIVGRKESGIVFAKDRFKTKNCLDNFRMWAKAVDQQKVSNHVKTLWSFSEPATHETQGKNYKNKG